MFTILEKILLITFLSSAISFFLYHFYVRLSIVFKGKGSFAFDHLLLRLKRLFDEVLLHKKVISKQRTIVGFLHLFVMYGFIFFGLITLNHFLIPFDIKLFSPSFKLNYFYFVGLPWAILCLIGILGLAYRRFFIKPKFLGEQSKTSAVVALFIFLLMVTYLYDEFHLWNSLLQYKVNWWLHSFVIGSFLFLIPKSKHMHLVLSPFNIFLKPFDNPDHAPVPIDLEASEEELDNLLLDLSRLSKNQALDIFTCVECGRCTDRKSTRLNSSHVRTSRMPSSA